MDILLVGKTSSITTTIQTMLQSIEDWSVWLYSDVTTLSKSKEAKTEFDLLVANIEDFNEASTTVVTQICEQFPNTPLLIIHSYHNKKLIKPMITAGATGYLRNDVSENKLVEAVQKVAAGTTCIIAEST